MDSPVPASMFAPEPSSPGAARAAAAAARLHGGFDSDCSEDGEALNGEPELDLTSKVGLGAGDGAKGTRRLGDRAVGRAISEATAGEGRGPSPPTCGCRRRWGLLGKGRPQHRRPSRPPRLGLPRRSQPLGSATWNAGARRPQRLAQCCLRRDRGGPLPGLSTAAEGRRWLGEGGAEAREDQVLREGTGRRLLVLGKETESSRSVREKDVWGMSTLRIHPKQN